ncbi:hypothetical protein EYS14_13455 [Alteromonadaceae bacterium M269]|nr:hypothetical protein EYS14_13455 [Alteromonadaceae bacterium M269]
MTDSLDEEFKEVSHMIKPEEHYMFGVDESVSYWLKPETMWLIENTHFFGDEQRTADEFVHHLIKTHIGEVKYDSLMRGFEEGKASIIKCAKLQRDYIRKQIDAGENPSSDI